MILQKQSDIAFALWRHKPQHATLYDMATIKKWIQALEEEVKNKRWEGGSGGGF